MSIKRILLMTVSSLALTAQASDLAPCNGAGGALHPNGGGFVADTAEVDSSVFVAEGAQVCDLAIVRGDVRLGAGVKVYENANIYDQANISGRVKIFGNASVFGNARIAGNPSQDISNGILVFGNAQISGNTRVTGNVLVFDNAIISEYAHVGGNVRVQDNARIRGNGVVFSGHVVSIHDNAQVSGSANVINEPLGGNLHAIGNTRFRNRLIFLED